MHLQDAFLYSIGILQTYFPCQSEGFTVQPFKMDTKVDVEDEIVIIFLPCLNLNWLLHRYMKFYIQCNEWSQTNKCHFFQQIMFSNEITMTASLLWPSLGLYPQGLVDYPITLLSMHMHKQDVHCRLKSYLCCWIHIILV